MRRRSFDGWHGMMAGLVLLAASAPATAALKADYQFADDLTSSVPGAPDLVDLGASNVFAMDIVLGQPWTVFQFEAGTGLRLSTDTILPGGAVYSIVMLFELTMIESETVKIIDFKNLTTDDGLYRLFDSLLFWDDGWIGTGDPFLGKSYAQVVLTRDLGGTVTGYVDGEEYISFSDTGELAVISAEDFLHFFHDDATNTEISSGAVARLRLYDEALTSQEVADLDTLPGAPPPVVPGWRWIDTTHAINRWSMSLAYDSQRQRTVMFGGRLSDPCCGLLSDTWEFDGTSWSEVSTAHAPAARIWHAMVYDSQRQRMVLFGGGDPDLGLYFNDTWEYDGVDWTEMLPPTSPPPMQVKTMVYDSVRGRVVLFGGESDTGNFNDTWEYDGSSWTLISTANSPPPPSALAAMDFDASRNRTVVTFNWSGGVLDTWEYDGSDWTEMSPATAPPTRWAHTMAYDPVRERIFLFGGYSPDIDSQVDDTWEYDGSDWSLVLSPERPGEREQHEMAYDSTRRRMVLVGGIGHTSGDDTWVFLLPEVFADGFESGDVSGWSSSVP